MKSPKNMGFHVAFTKKVSEEIGNIVSWYQEQSPAVAEKWHHNLLEAIHTLENIPERCPVIRKAAFDGMERRQLLFGNKQGQYRIIFRIHRKTVYVLRVSHTARKVKKP